MIPTQQASTQQIEKTLSEISRKILLDLAAADEQIKVRYSYMFCEICEQDYRELIVRFEDGSVFTLCKACVMDLREVIEIFGLHCSIQPF